MPVKKFSFKDADRQDTSKPAGLPKKKKVSSKFGAKEEASPAPTPKLGLKKKKDAKAEEAAVKIEDKKVHPIKKDEPKAEPVAPPKPPTPEPAEPVVEIEKGDPEINETVVLGLSTISVFRALLFKKKRTKIVVVITENLHLKIFYQTRC